MIVTDSHHQKQDELGFARWVMLLAAVFYPVWGLFCIVMIPGHHEPIWLRGAIAALCLALWGLSHLSRAVAVELPRAVLPVYLLLTAHYFYVVGLHRMGTVYVIGIFITVGAVNGLIAGVRPLLMYSLVVMLAGVCLVQSAADAGTSGPVFLFGLFTQQVIALVSAVARARAARRLAAAKFELAARGEALERANQELRQADRYKDDFLAIISHELRTPLNAVLGFGSVLGDEVDGQLSPTQHHYVDKIVTSADSLLALVNDLLDMSRIQAGKFSLEPGPVHFADLTDEALSPFGPLVTRSGQQLVIDVPRTLPVLDLDAQRIGQVLTNLVGNAVKFNRADGTVTVRAWKEAQTLRCEVSDQGDGIAPEDLAKLFLPFTQVDSSATRRAGGTGLGLSICKALVEAHGGRIGVRSAPGQGSVFWFTVPL